MSHPHRVYQCGNPQCESFRARISVPAEVIGSFLAWPTLVCLCGYAPTLVDSSLRNEQRALADAAELGRRAYEENR